MKQLLTLILMLITTMSVSAQTVIRGDMDGDNNVTAADVARVVATVTGKLAKDTIDIAALHEDRSALVGIWHHYDQKTESQDGYYMYMLADGTMPYQLFENNIYRYIPNIGNKNGILVLYDRDTEEMTSMTEIRELTENKLVVSSPGSEEVDIWYKTIPITGLSIAPLNITGDPGETCQLTLTLTPSTEVTNQYIEWGSTNPNVATVSNTGFVTMVGSGSCTIFCRSTDGSYLSCSSAIHVRQKVNSITFDHTSLLLSLNMSVSLTPTISPANVDDNNVTWTSSDPSIATVSADGVVTGVAAGTATITCTAQDGSEASASCEITVQQHEYVDLGLPSGTLWATTNVGAILENNVGDEYRWGETTPYPTGISNNDWNLYKYANGSGDKLTKYCISTTNSNDGTADNLWQLVAEDDAATANWGEDWCTPSKEQWQELIDNCDWEFVGDTDFTHFYHYTGNQGYRIKSKTDNTKSIFIPFSGMWEETFTRKIYFTGYYWTKDLDITVSSQQANGFYINDNKPAFESKPRYYGRRIRPVRK